jgi:hypothetical protein
MCSSYVEIDEDGQCDRMYIPTTEDLEAAEEEEDEE